MTQESPQRLRSNATILQLEEFFGGSLSIRDATDSLRLQPIQCDIDNAEQKNPMNCIFAKCVQRQYGATKVIFWKRHAYIDLVGTDGVRCIERYLVPAPTSRQIEAFDRGEPLELGRAFVLMPPTHSRTLAVLRQNNRIYHASEHGKIVNKAHTKELTVRRARAQVSKIKEELQTETMPKEMREKKKTALAKKREALKVLVTEMKEAWEAAEAISSRIKRYHREGRGFNLFTRDGQHNYKIQKLTEEI